MGWIYLLLGGLFEIGWPLGFKLAQTTPYRLPWILFSVVSMALSGWLLYIAQKTIPIGTAYVVWTGIGAVGTLLLGILLFHDSASIWRLMSASLIIIGVIGLKVVS